jgi:hypothetical protein
MDVSQLEAACTGQLETRGRYQYKVVRDSQ